MLCMYLLDAYCAINVKRLTFSFLLVAMTIDSTLIRLTI